MDKTINEQVDYIVKEIKKYCPSVDNFNPHPRLGSMSPTVFELWTDTVVSTTFQCHWEPERVALSLADSLSVVRDSLDKQITELVKYVGRNSG